MSITKNVVVDFNRMSGTLLLVRCIASDSLDGETKVVTTMRHMLFLAVAMLLSVQLTSAVPAELKFRRIDTRDGLSNTQVNCVLKDHHGFVWIGTDYGLNRYDGFRMRTFFSDTKDPNSMKYDFVDEMFEDIDGNLWLRHDSHYSIFCQSAERFDNDVQGRLLRRGVKGTVEKMHIDAQKNIWVKVYGGPLYCLDARGKTTRKVEWNLANGAKATKMEIASFAERGQLIYVATLTGDIYCIDKKRPKARLLSNYASKSRPANRGDNKLYVDPKGIVWVLSVGRVYVYVPKERRWYDSLKLFLNHIGINNVPERLQVWDVNTDNSGSLLFATDHDGLLVVDTDNKAMRKYVYQKDDETSVSDINISNIYRAYDGTVWLGTYKSGLNEVVEDGTNFKHLPMGDINTIAEDGRGNFWMGTNDRGLVCYNPTNGSQRLFDKGNSGLASNVIVCSHAGRGGNLWFGTYEGGLACFDGNKWHSYMANQTQWSPVNNNVWAVDEDFQGRVWIGTLGGGVQCIDMKHGKSTLFNTKNSGIASNYVSSLSVLPNGHVLAGTSTFYSVIDPISRKVYNKTVPQDATQHQNTIATSTQVVQDSRGLVWYCALSGVSVYDPSTGNAVLLNVKSGIRSSNICGVVEDLRHNMWVISDHGVSNVVPQRHNDGNWTFTVHTFDSRDGLKAMPYNWRSMLLTSHGLLLVGGRDGVDIINPMLFNNLNTNGKPLFSGVLLYGKEIIVGHEYDGRVILRKSLNDDGQLHLRYSDNQFTVLLASSSVSAHSSTRFAYMLEGLTKQWLTTSEEAQEITFTGLPSGDYTLHVRQLNDDGTMGDEEQTLQIIISPPWWRSAWALAVYLVMLAAAAYVLYQRLKKKARLTKKRIEQEKEIQANDAKRNFAASMSSEMRIPLENTFASLNTLMSKENDESRYDKEYTVYTNLESILTQMNKVLESASKKIIPKIKDIEVTSLDEKLVKDATDYVEENLSNSDITVETMSEAMSMSRVHLYKRLLSLTGNTPSEFIRIIRLRHAEKLLRLSQLNVSEISYKVGFSNPRYFSKYFKDMYGMLPSQYKAEKAENSKQQTITIKQDNQ